MMKRLALCCLIAALFGLTGPLEARADEETPFQLLGRVEQVVYGGSQAGGLIARLGRVEQELFGRELPGSIAERQQALLTFIDEGSQGQPSFLFKLGVAEWAVSQRTFPAKSAKERIADLELLLEGQPGEERPLAMRLERLVALLLAEGITWEDLSLSAGSLVKVELLEGLSPRTAEKDQAVAMAIRDDLIVDGRLVAPKGSAVVGHVAEVKPPRSFGRSAEVKIAFDHLVPLGPERIGVFLGERAKEAAKTDKEVLTAAGASFLGLVVLGPVGLATGFLIRGGEKDLPAGTLFYLETATATDVKAFPIPVGLQGLMQQQVPPLSPDAEDFKERGDGNTPLN